MHVMTESRKARSLADLVLTERQLVDNYYPESRTLLSTGWSHFKCPRTSTHYDYLAMDCEMVYTEKGLELARATLVDEDGTAVYDQLVLPPNPIIDYNTK